jgi:hypothetical protein
MTHPTHLPPPEPSSLRYRLGVAVALAMAFGALYAGIRATQTGEDTTAAGGRQDVVEQLIPRDGAEVLQQAEIGIDLTRGYEGALQINGVEIPVEELRVVPEQSQVFFAPGPDRVFESLPSGTTCATAVVWQQANGRGVDDLTFTWCFDVT